MTYSICSCAVNFSKFDAKTSEFAAVCSSTSERLQGGVIDSDFRGASTFGGAHCRFWPLTFFSLSCGCLPADTTAGNGARPHRAGISRAKLKTLQSHLDTVLCRSAAISIRLPGMERVPDKSSAQILSPPAG